MFEISFILFFMTFSGPPWLFFSGFALPCTLLSFTQVLPYEKAKLNELIKTDNKVKRVFVIGVI